MIADFANPAEDIDRLLVHYEPLITRSERTIVIFAVGNSQHILTYRGVTSWARDTVQWARYTNGQLPGDRRHMHYGHIAGIVREFKARARAHGITLEVYDQVDPGNEFVFEVWKYDVHPECMDRRWDSFDIRGRLRPDTHRYASAPGGTPAGMSCGTFLVNQVQAYLADFEFDGILYGNQFGTRGRWLPDSGPGYSVAEASAIREFLAYSRQAYGLKGLMWFDSYNNTRIERDVFSFPTDGYPYFDYLIASGFAVITDSNRYRDNLRSKVSLRPRPRVLATLDYVDPWYSYRSMIDYADESDALERTARSYRDRIDGVMFFANDANGQFVPRDRIDRFVREFYGSRP
jgi:hypothetical protein